MTENASTGSTKSKDANIWVICEAFGAFTLLKIKYWNCCAEVRPKFALDLLVFDIQYRSMDLFFLSSSLHSTHTFEYTGVSIHNGYAKMSDLHVMCSESVDIDGSEKTAPNEHSKRKRKLALRTKNKKTHLWQFNIRQRRSKRPKPVPKMYLSGANLVRFGAFCGIRDSRATRCSLRGISHGIYIKSGIRCACNFYTLYPSPLVCLVESVRDKAVGALSNP